MTKWMRTAVQTTLWMIITSLKTKECTLFLFSLTYCMYIVFRLVKYLISILTIIFHYLNTISGHFKIPKTASRQTCIYIKLFLYKIGKHTIWRRALHYYHVVLSNQVRNHFKNVHSHVFFLLKNPFTSSTFAINLNICFFQTYWKIEQQYFPVSFRESKFWIYTCISYQTA